MPPQENRSSGPSPSPAPAPAPAASGDRARADGPSPSLAYDQRPDFYGPGPRVKTAKSIALACAFAAALGAVGYGIGTSSLGGSAARAPAGKIAVADPRNIVSIVRDAKEEEKIQRALKANEPVPALAHAPPEARAQVASGELRVAFLRVVQPGERGDRVAVYVNGKAVGELDMNDVRSSVAVPYRPGEVITLHEEVTGTSGAPGLHQFDAPDGQSFVMVKSVGARIDWKGGID